MLGIIGGSGLGKLVGLEGSQRKVARTPWGQPSSALTFGRLGGQPVVFIARHGYGHTIAPHDINYQANIWALREAGATALVACTVVGGIRADLQPGTLVVPDQIIDYTWGRKASYFSGVDQPVVHVDFSEPYDEGVRGALLEAARAAGQAVVADGCYGCTQGPRLETVAEVRRYERDGCDMLGLTAMPEAALARELDLPYAALAVVTNRAAGKDGTAAGTRELSQIGRTLETVMPRLLAVLTETAGQLARSRTQAG
ncbi:MAG: S-methyl-5'-thioinosine phosphorylase [Lautropia sp.]|nr:S-methyl-5'-thioinosine phosphorylase [Lautropia sp.]